VEVRLRNRPGMIIATEYECPFILMEELKRMNPGRIKPPVRLCLALMASAVAGCSLLPQKGWGTPPSGAPSLVQDCGIVTISSPTRYVCGGKVYTSFELERNRLKWETAQNTETHLPGVPVKY
jgi:hypothetical protein